MLGDLAGLGGGLAAWLALDHDIEVNEFLSEGGHVVLEAEGVFADVVCSENVVALALAYAIEEDLVVGVLHLVVDVEGATSLNLQSVRPPSKLIEHAREGRTAK